MGCPRFIRWSPLVAIALLLTGSAGSHAATRIHLAGREWASG
jgi:hypothetical protein